MALFALKISGRLAGILLLVGSLASCDPGYSSGVTNALASEIPASRLYEFTMDDIDGQPVSLSRFRGKVLLIVNTASFCGNTPQYGGLQELYER